MGNHPGRGSKRPGLRLLELLIVIVVVTAILVGAHPEALSPQEVRDFVLSFGVLAPVVFALLYLGAVFIPYGTTILTIAAGLAFGPLWGSILTFSITIVASLLPFTISRHLGRDWVEEKVGNTRVEKYAEQINRNAFLVFFYLRLIPGLPYEAQNYIAGITRISTTQFFLATVFGIGPIIFVLAFLGDSLTDPGSPQFWLAAGIYLTVLLAPIFTAVILKKLGKAPLLTRIGRAGKGRVPKPAAGRPPRG
jgi:uncharacterized membrane protein YdjX (TVP38/TMEM64 family)